MKLKVAVVFLFAFVFTSTLNAQDAKGWHLLDPQKDKVYGISLSETYNFLKGKKATPDIVAVIDSGIDTAHEDLKNILWTNPKEIPGNGIDDDGNGYVDDVHGWNFLGNKDGTNLKKASDERTRVYYRFKDEFEGKEVDEDTMNENEKAQYELWQKAASQMKVDSEDQLELTLLDVTLKALEKHNKVLQTEMNKTDFTVDQLEDFQPSTVAGRQAKLNYLTVMKLLGVDSDEKNTTLLSELQEEVEGKKESFKAKSTPPPDYRAEIIKDNYYDINDRYYGNPDIMGPSPMHGTHVSGIIAAQRNNNIGMDGVADDVKIMMIRAVPDGDEYDKDVALAIKYAVDNGAKVINMSFGKGFSPEKKWVDEAVRYAESKDVLIVHAAGNEAANVDSTDNYPNPYLKEFDTTATNFINVGASGDKHIGNGSLVAYFSNYGRNSVDVFAPGMKIYSTLPGGNEYGFLQGTSMAAPVVAGVAALIRSYYPQLSAQQVKYVIDSSTSQLGDSVKVIEPGTNKLVTMKDLSESGGIINAYGAVKLASTLKPEVKEEKAPQLPKATFKNSKIKE